MSSASSSCFISGQVVSQIIVVSSKDGPRPFANWLQAMDRDNFSSKGTRLTGFDLALSPNWFDNLFCFDSLLRLYKQL